LALTISSISFYIQNSAPSPGVGGGGVPQNSELFQRKKHLMQPSSKIYIFGVDKVIITYLQIELSTGRGRKGFLETK
jgi:hypothetical protein